MQKILYNNLELKREAPPVPPFKIQIFVLAFLHELSRGGARLPSSGQSKGQPGVRSFPCRPLKGLACPKRKFRLRLGRRFLANWGDRGPLRAL